MPSIIQYTNAMNIVVVNSKMSWQSHHPCKNRPQIIHFHIALCIEGNDVESF